mmetsp:Transcript_5213/g.12366  ORF Transcript_5213/g.12366 Transcript_5213/m.12366 type:complete len:318 (+) Transcript_5213:232-1185(+)
MHVSTNSWQRIHFKAAVKIPREHPRNRQPKTKSSQRRPLVEIGDFQGGAGLLRGGGEEIGPGLAHCPPVHPLPAIANLDPHTFLLPSTEENANVCQLSAFFFLLHGSRAKTILQDLKVHVKHVCVHIRQRGNSLKHFNILAWSLVQVHQSVIDEHSRHHSHVTGAHRGCPLVRLHQQLRRAALGVHSTNEAGDLLRREIQPDHMIDHQPHGHTGGEEPVQRVFNLSQDRHFLPQAGHFHVIPELSPQPSLELDHTTGQMDHRRSVPGENGGNKLLEIVRGQGGKASGVLESLDVLEVFHVVIGDSGDRLRGRKLEWQ